MGLEEPVGVLATMNRAHALRAFGAFAGAYGVLGAECAAEQDRRRPRHALPRDDAADGPPDSRNSDVHVPADLAGKIVGLNQLHDLLGLAMTPVFAAPSLDPATLQPVIDAAVKYGWIAKNFDVRAMML